MMIKYNEYLPVGKHVDKSGYLNYRSLVGQLSVKSGVIKISEIEYAKNIIMAGMGYFTPRNLITRAQGFIDYYQDFFPKPNFLTATHFLQPNGYAYDPTMIAHFSNIIGKTNAHILFKKLSYGWFSYSFEGYALQKGYSIKGKRPDLVGISRNNKVYTLEAKGWSDPGTDKRKYAAIQQAISVNIKQQTGIAVISKNIYTNIEVDYIDPPIDGPIIESIDNNYLINSYYTSIFDRSILPNESRFTVGNVTFQAFDFLYFLGKKYLIGIDVQILDYIFPEYGQDDESKRKYERILNDENQRVYKEISNTESQFVDVDGIGLFLVSDDNIELQNILEKVVLRGRH
ncbi:hypothetical protein HPA05_07780 [Streptococcus suis]|nr:hypothetical protein [Streptococcus suis]